MVAMGSVQAVKMIPNGPLVYALCDNHESEAKERSETAESRPESKEDSKVESNRTQTQTLCREPGGSLGHKTMDCLGETIFACCFRVQLGRKELSLAAIMNVSLVQHQWEVSLALRTILRSGRWSTGNL